MTAALNIVSTPLDQTLREFIATSMELMQAQNVAARTLYVPVEADDGEQATATFCLFWQDMALLLESQGVDIFEPHERKLDS